MAKLGISLAAALMLCLAALAASVLQQQDIMRDHSSLPPWFAFTFGFKVRSTSQLTMQRLWQGLHPSQHLRLLITCTSTIAIAMACMYAAHLISTCLHNSLLLSAIPGIQSDGTISKLGNATASQNGGSSTEWFPQEPSDYCCQ